VRADAGYSTIKLENDHGAVLAAKAQPKASRRFSMDSPRLAPGRYHVVYRVLSPDGDMLRGRVDFVVDE